MSSSSIPDSSRTATLSLSQWQWTIALSAGLKVESVCGQGQSRGLAGSPDPGQCHLFPSDRVSHGFPVHLRRGGVPAGRIIASGGGAPEPSPSSIGMSGNSGSRGGGFDTSYMQCHFQTKRVSYTEFANLRSRLEDVDPICVLSLCEDSRLVAYPECD